MIQGISSFRYVEPMSYYMYGAGHSHADVVSPVKPIKAIVPLSDGTDRLRTVVSYPSEGGDTSAIQEMSVTKQDEKIRAAYQQSSQAEYDLSNPYENARMTTEGILLTGMNFNQLA